MIVKPKKQRLWTTALLTKGTIMCGFHGIMEIQVSERELFIKLLNPNMAVKNFSFQYQIMLLWHSDKLLSAENEEKIDVLFFLKRLVDARTFKLDFTKCRLELRSGLKTGFGLDFYTPSKSVSFDADLNKSKLGSNLKQNMPGK